MPAKRVRTSDLAMLVRTLSYRAGKALLHKAGAHPRSRAALLKGIRCLINAKGTPEKVEDFFQDTHNYLKYLKFGYGRCTDHVSLEIRHQRMSREEGIKMIEKFEHLIRPSNLDNFLKFAELSEEEFLSKIEHLRDQSIWEKDSQGKWQLKDWIGNHVSDKGVEDARLPIKEKWVQIKSPPHKSPRDYSSDDDKDEIVFL